MCELLWSDPQPLMGRSLSKRGVGIQFGPDVTKTFCELNNLKCIIRSHEVKVDGYEIDHDGRCNFIYLTKQVLLYFQLLIIVILLGITAPIFT